MAKAFINDENLTDIADAIRATLDESRQYLPSEMAAAIDSIPIMTQLNRKKYFQSVPTGAASGYATIEKIEGNTVAWNQLSGLNTASFTAGVNTQKILKTELNIPAGHVLLFIWHQDDTLLSAERNTPFVRDGGVNRYQSTAGNNNLSAGWYSWRYVVSSNVTELRYWGNNPNANYTISAIHIYDLTAIFGAGNEPTTVADFEAWLAQNIGTLPYYDYNAGELLSVKMSGMQTEDSSQQTLDTIALDVTTITGINTATNVREVVFPNGMKQADREGTVKDTLDLLSDTATVNVGSRAYQAGDESDTTVITDGTTTYYALTTPIEYTDLQDGNGNPLNPRYKVEQGGTEQVLPVNTSTPTTVAPTLSTIYKKNA